jgi:hypothetical protein
VYVHPGLGLSVEADPESTGRCLPLTHPDPTLLIRLEWGLTAATSYPGCRFVIDGGCGHLPGYDGRILNGGLVGLPGERGAVSIVPRVYDDLGSSPVPVKGAIPCSDCCTSRSCPDPAQEVTPGPLAVVDTDAGEF